MRRISRACRCRCTTSTRTGCSAPSRMGTAIAIRPCWRANKRAPPDSSSVKPKAAALFYTALSLIATFPLVLHMRSALPHDLGDPSLSASLLWWNAHVLPLTERWWNGFAFVPAEGMLAFSDHRLGLGIIATPLQWLGAGPITAYNVVFLLTYPLCALGGYALGFVLTRRHDAAFLCGLTYGFNPFRVAHVGHIEMLAAFAMPAALAA